MGNKNNWGIKLMKELMDTVEFESTAGGTTVTMTKTKQNISSKKDR